MIRSVAAVLAAAWLATAAPAVFAAETRSAGTPVTDATTDALYRSVAVVTGTRVETRSLGFAHALGDVLVKLTGDRTIVQDARFAALAAKAGDYVERFSYRDRKEGLPLIDEQGTYDRPHDLTVVFDRARIDTLARELGREPWVGPRPRVIAFVGIDNVAFSGGKGTPHSYVLTRDGMIDRSADMREAFAAASVKAGMAVALPTHAQLAVQGWTAKTLIAASSAALAKVAHDNGGEIAVVGRMVFAEETLGWVTAWRMEHGGKTYRWGERGVNFDAAFRNALFGVAKFVSGHGAPE